MARVGLFGGTFNPIHVGHLTIAEEACLAAGLDKVVFIPSGDPYQKPASELAGRLDRLEMTRLAVHGDERFEVSDIETRRMGPSYTCDTLEEYARTHPGDELYLILGADSLMGIETWRSPGGIFRRCHVLALARGGIDNANLSACAQALRDKYAARITLIDTFQLNLSASDLRRWIAENHAWRHLVPEAVCRYIRAHGLYGARAEST